MAKWNYRRILERIIWANCVSHQDEESGFFEIVGEPTKENRGEIYKKGMLLDFNPHFLSFSIPAYVPLTWKQLSLKIGLNVPHLVDDGHECPKCPKYETCKAYFKDDPKQNACNFWYQQVDGTIYQKNIEKYSNKEEDGEITVK